MPQFNDHYSFFFFPSFCSFNVSEILKARKKKKLSSKNWIEFKWSTAKTIWIPNQFNSKHQQQQQHQRKISKKLVEHISHERKVQMIYWNRKTSTFLSVNIIFCNKNRTKKKKKKSSFYFFSFLFYHFTILLLSIIFKDNFQIFDKLIL